MTQETDALCFWPSPRRRVLAVTSQPASSSCWWTGVSRVAAGCPAASLLPTTGSIAGHAIFHAGAGGLPAVFRQDDYICKALGNALGWRVLCKCKIMLFIEPGFIQNGIKHVFLKPLLSKKNWNLSPFLWCFASKVLSLVQSKFKECILFKYHTSQKVNGSLSHQLWGGPGSLDSSHVLQPQQLWHQSVINQEIKAEFELD